MPATKPNFDNLKALLEEYNTKQASVKSAYNVPEKGNASPVTTGALHAENSADVKKNAPGCSVEEAGTPSDDTSSNVHPMGLGLHQAELDDMTGFDKIVKEYKYNVNKEANSQLDLSSDDAISKAAAEFIQNAATVDTIIKQAYNNAAKSGNHSKEASQKVETPTSGQVTGTTVDKNDQLAQAVIADHIKMAHDRADLVACFYKGWNDTTAALVKMAEDGTLKEVLDSQDTDDADEKSEDKSEVSESGEGEEEEASTESEEGGSGDAAAAAGAGAGGQVDPAVLAALSGGAGGAGAGGPEEQLGAMSNGMLDVGQNPEMLQQLLMQALMQAQQEQQAQPPASMVGKMAKAAADKIKDHLAVIDVVKNHMYSGDFERSESKTAAQKKMRKEARKYYSELLREYFH